MNRSELNEKAKKHISDTGFGTGTNITLHGAKCLMVDFYLDNQVKNNVVLADVSNRRELLIAFKNWEVDNDVKNLLPEQVVDFYIDESN